MQKRYIRLAIALMTLLSMVAGYIGMSEIDILKGAGNKVKDYGVKKYEEQKKEPGSINGSKITKKPKKVKKAEKKKPAKKKTKKSGKKGDSLAKLEYKGKMIVVVNKNVPKFSKTARKKTVTYTKYSNLDKLGRCGKVTALIGPETLAEEKRGSIGMYKPTGWHTIRYNIVGKGSAGYLYNRCHLLAFCLNGNSTNNEKNLITGTRQFNAGKRSMLTYELKTVKYIEKTGNHVLYRVTPVFRKGELVARGVQMEGYSIEDKGRGIKFNVFIHNRQDGITLNYKTGDSKADNGEKGKGAYGNY